MFLASRAASCRSAKGPDWLGMKEIETTCSMPCQSFDTANMWGRTCWSFIGLLAISPCAEKWNRVNLLAADKQTCYKHGYIW